MKLIVGLGNPGQAYRHTRHNLGYRVLDALSEELGASFSREKFRGQIAECTVQGTKVLLLKPMTFMNKSGESVARAARNKVSDPGDKLHAVAVHAPRVILEAEPAEGEEELLEGEEGEAAEGEGDGESKDEGGEDEKKADK